MWLTFALSNILLAQEKKDTSLVSTEPDSTRNTGAIKSDTSSAQDTARKTSPVINVIPVIKLESLKGLTQIDSSTKKKLLKKLIPQTHGNISAGYDYGIIPFAAKTGFPIGYYSSQGNVGVSALGLPLNLTYYYSSLTNVAGLNNYFRVSFDPLKYKETLQQNAYQKIDKEKAKLSQLMNMQQLLQQKLSYSESMLQNIPSQASLNSKLQTYTSKYNVNQYSFDSLQVVGVNGKDSLKAIKSNKSKSILLAYTDSLINLTNKLKGYDSVTKKIVQYKQDLETIQKQVHAINNRLEFLQNPQQALQNNNPYLKKSEAVLSGVKTLDIGLCYPNYSAFLVNGSTLKGVNLEWEKKLYFAFTFGKTINTVLTTNNIIQNQLQTGRNLYNFFDFNNVRDSRKIMAVKFGIGKKESTHIYAGFLYGVGLPSYLNTSLPESMEKNVAIELDGKIAMGSSNSLDVVVGKSALYQTGISEIPERSASQYILSKFRSNAALVRYNSSIQRTKTKITLMGRLVDPFFKSYGVGFMRSDNLRYEFKIEQEITNKIKFTAFYRKDRDNLLNTSLYTTNLQTMGANLFIKVNKRFMIRAAYTPVVQNIASKDSMKYNKQYLNNISNLVLTYSPRFIKINSFFNAMYSYYQFAGTGGKNNNFQNYNLSNTTIFSPSFKMNIAANGFFNNSSDSLNSNTLMASGNITYMGKNGTSLTLGVKYATNKLIQNQTGGLLKINIPIIKYIHAEIQAEKLVLGDFYNSYNMVEIKKFPYYGYGKIIISW